MTRSHRVLGTRVAVALVAALAVAACGSPSSGATPKPGVPTEGPATNVAAAPTTVAEPGEPCSVLTVEAIAAIVGTAVVEVYDRGRGDCDFFLSAAKDAKVNIGVTTGPDAQSAFDSAKGIGDPQPVSLGDEAYSFYSESIGTVVVVRKGNSTILAQALTSADPTQQLVQATALATAVLSGL